MYKCRCNQLEPIKTTLIQFSVLFLFHFSCAFLIEGIKFNQIKINQIKDEEIAVFSDTSGNTRITSYTAIKPRLRKLPKMLNVNC